MTSREMLKPLGFGVVLGAIASIVVAFSAGWVVTSGRLHGDVESARVDTLADVCVANVVANRKANGTDTDLSGYDTAARHEREALAKQFAVTLPDQPELSKEGQAACANMLDDSRA